MQKWRWFLRAVLFWGNCIALILLSQDAAQQLLHSPDDDRAEAAMLMPYQNAMDDDLKGRAQEQMNDVRNGGNRQQQQRMPDHVPHPMQRRPQNAKLKKRQGRADIIDEADLLTAANFLHYLIHIPKAGGTFARHQLNKDIRANKLVRRRGILCDRGVSPVNNYVNWPTYYDYLARDRLAERKEARRLGPDAQAPKITKSVRQDCSMYMTESHWSDVPQHVYSIIRDPREHLVSAYFHCKESKQHGKKFGHLMPDTLDEWLDEWVETKRKGKGLLKAQALKRMERYRCYNPINMQATLLLSPASPASYGEENSPVPASKDSLKKRFDVLGLTSQMDKSLCLIFIRWNGIVPNRCDCSNESNGKRRVQETDDGDSADANGDTEEEGGDITGAARSITGKLEHHGAIHSHNVTNHGGTHEHTKEQLAAIEELADMDMKLYAVAEELFAEQVEEVEREFSIKLC
jgi:hypothetical protein